MMTFGYPPKTSPPESVPATLAALYERLNARYATTSALATKADASALATKADVSALAAKANITDVANGYIPFLDSAPGAMGIRKKVSATYGTGWVFGNASSFGFSGTGTPTEIAGAFGIYQEYGKSTPGASVTKTTQGGYAITNYWGPTTDDSAEGFSSAVILKSTAGVPFTQTKPLTAFEAIAQVETGNSVSGAGSYALGVGSRINALGTGTIDVGYGFKASVNTSGGPPYGTITTYYGFAQLNGSGATNAYGVYVVDKINSETAVSIGKSAFSGSLSAKLTGNGDSSNSMLLLNLPTATDIPGTLTGIRIVAPTGQTKPLQEWFGAGSGTAGSRVDSGGNFSARTSINLTDSTFSNNLLRLDSTGITMTTGMNLTLSTAAGTKIGTATSQKLAFYGAAPVTQQARPTDTATIITLLTTLGLCA